MQSCDIDDSGYAESQSIHDHSTQGAKEEDQLPDRHPSPVSPLQRPIMAQATKDMLLARREKLQQRRRALQSRRKGSWLLFHLLRPSPIQAQTFSAGLRAAKDEQYRYIRRHLDQQLELDLVKIPGQARRGPPGLHLLERRDHRLGRDPEGTSHKQSES